MSNATELLGAAPAARASRAGRAGRAARAAALAAAGLLALSLAACDSTDDTAAQGSPSAAPSPSASPSWDAMAGTTPLPSKSAKAAPTPEIHPGPTTPKERAALYGKDAKTVKCTPGANAEALAKASRTPEEGPLVVVGNDHVMGAPALVFDGSAPKVEAPSVSAGAQEMDTVEYCLHIGHGSATVSWAEVRDRQAAGPKTYKVAPDKDGWARVPVLAGAGLPNAPMPAGSPASVAILTARQDAPKGKGYAVDVAFSVDAAWHQ
ncbi:hypothetical protein [Sinomonas sp. RB5]